MSNDITKVVVRQQVAPQPSTLQQTGAFISQGGTTLAPNANAFLSQYADLAALLPTPVVVSSMTWSGGVVTVTTATPHGIPAGKMLNGVIAGVAPTGYNGTYECTQTGTTTFTYPLTNNPGVVTTQGTWTPYSALQLQQMATTFFAPGNQVGVYILELGLSDPPTGIAALAAYCLAPAKQFYAYLFPREWGADSTAPELATTFNGDDSQLYFYATILTANISAWTANPAKSARCLVEAASIGALEFSSAANFLQLLLYNPSNVNKAAPMAFRYVSAVTPLNPSDALKTQLRTAFVNFIDTGAEGGISNTLIKFGTDMTGLDQLYWFSADWMNINCQQAVTAAVINGNNNPTNPLYYNQAGIDVLQDAAQQEANTGVAVGTAASGPSGPPIVTAIPYSTYIAEFPGDFEAGDYNGLALTVTPNSGFKSITFYLTVSQLAPT